MEDNFRFRHAMPVQIRFSDVGQLRVRGEVAGRAVALILIKEMSLMPKYLVVTLLLLSAQVHYAWGQLTLRSFELAESDLSAQKYERLDADGNRCALIRVQLPVAGCVFMGAKVGSVDFKAKEYWLYVIPNTKKISISCPGIEQSVIVWQSRVGPSGVKSGRTYMMWLDGYESAAEPAAVKKDKPSTLSVSVGQIYDEAQEAFKEKDYAKAVSLYRQAAEREHVKAQGRLGYCFVKGYGVDIDYKEAVKWFRNAAMKDDAGSQANLGHCYYKGLGVDKDFSKAVYWFKKSAEQGHSLGQLFLGECYFKGEGVTKDYVEALRWYGKSAEQGDYRAQYRLGNCYRMGRGVAQDYREAVKWYRQSADQGYAPAQYYMGFFYENGYGVTKDMKEAVEWYRRAAAEGYERAENRLGKLSQTGQ